MRAVGLLVVFLTALAPVPARANEFTQFQNAREAYDSLNYELAVELFGGLLSSAAVDDTRPLVLESRKYLAASHLFLGRNEEGEAQFAHLLRAVPDYRLDPLAFPAEVQETFDRVRQQLADQSREAARRAEAEKQQVDAAEQTRRRGRQARLDRLIELAKTERVEQKRSRMIAMLPFGIGQFQNGDSGLGLVLAVTEGTLLAAGVTTYVLHEDLPDRPKINEADDVNTAEQVYRWGNNISMGLLAVVAITGIVDAQLRFKQSTSEDRPRRIPAELDDIELGLGIGPGFVTLEGSF